MKRIRALTREGRRRTAWAKQVAKLKAEILELWTITTSDLRGTAEFRWALDPWAP